MPWLEKRFERGRDGRREADHDALIRESAEAVATWQSRIDAVNGSLLSECRGIAAGLGVTGLGGGVPGHLGLAADYAIDETWAIDLDLQVGSAYIAGVGVRYRYGGE